MLCLLTEVLSALVLALDVLLWWACIPNADKLNEVIKMPMAYTAMAAAAGTAISGSTVMPMTIAAMPSNMHAMARVVWAAEDDVCSVGVLT